MQARIIAVASLCSIGLDLAVAHDHAHGLVLVGDQPLEAHR